MIHLYTWKTPNGNKISIMLEELDVPYEVKSIDISKNEQFNPEFLKISPNNKIPAIVDDDVRMNGGFLSVFESGAILTYLAEKYHQFLPKEGVERYKAFEWLYWQVGGFGPMLGQLGYFAVRAEEKLPHAIERFRDEAERLLTVMDKRLSETSYLAGKEYTIADMAIYPWAQAITSYLKEPLEKSLFSKPSVRRWMDLVGNRPAVMRGMNIPGENCGTIKSEHLLKNSGDYHGQGTRQG